MENRNECSSSTDADAPEAPPPPAAFAALCHWNMAVGSTQGLPASSTGDFYFDLGQTRGIPATRNGCTAAWVSPLSTQKLPPAQEGAARGQHPLRV